MFISSQTHNYLIYWILVKYSLQRSFISIIISILTAFLLSSSAQLYFLLRLSKIVLTFNPTSSFKWIPCSQFTLVHLYFKIMYLKVTMFFLTKRNLKVLQISFPYWYEKWNYLHFRSNTLSKKRPFHFFLSHLFLPFSKTLTKICE